MTRGSTESEVWWKKGVVYQIYPRSFMDSNGDGIGDIKGIISKLDYLNDGTENSLGVDAIWLSPIYKSPMKDFGYDISDYRDIDPMFGTMEDFKILLEEAHKRDIRIIMDLVINHTSDQHEWFIEASKDRGNPKRDWYIWQDKKPNNWISLFEMKSAWWLDEKTKQYYLGTFTRHQPEVNWNNKDLKNAMYDMIRYWLEMGVDGFRMDVVNWFIKDEKLRSNPWRLSLNPPDFQKHIYDRNRPETHEICREIRKITDEYNDRMLIGEVFTDDTAVAVSYYGTHHDELHMAFNFNFLFQKWNAKDFYNSITKWYSNLPRDAWPNFTLSNHDQPRHYYRYGNGKNAGVRARVAASLLLTLKGTPFIYYGEEIGMTCGKLKRSEIQDPVGKIVWPIIKSRDISRTPMQWSSSKNAGFTTGNPWLPVNRDYNCKNVSAQIKDEESTLSFYRSLIRLRKKHNELSLGDIEFIIHDVDNILVYKRIYKDECIIIVLNFSSRKQELNFQTGENVLSNENPDMEKTLIFGTHRKKGEKLCTRKVTIHPYEVAIFK